MLLLLGLTIVELIWVLYNVIYLITPVRVGRKHTSKGPLLLNKQNYNTHFVVIFSGCFYFLPFPEVVSSWITLNLH